MKKHMAKRILSLFLAVLMFCSVFVSTSFAESYCLPKKDKTPVIMVPGFAASALAKKNPITGKLTPVYPPTVPQIAKILGLNANELFSALLKFSEPQLKDAMTKIVDAFFTPLEMNPDGTSKNEIVPYLSKAEDTSLAALKRSGNTKYIPYGKMEFFNMKSLAAEVGDKNVFNFMYDWRMSSVDTAAQLHAYIEDVRRITGAKKVNLYCISQGTHVVGTYLYEYSDDNYLNNVVMESPAIGGSSMVADIVSSEPLSFHFDEFFKFLGTAAATEINIGAIRAAISEEKLNNILNFTLKDLIYPKLKYAPVVWELCAPDRYEEAKALNLDPVLSAKLIEKVEKTKNGLGKNIETTLRKQNQKGSLSIIAGYGAPIFSGTKSSSDGVVDVKYSCGATVAPFGEKLPANYKQQAMTDLNLISPDRTVDLSTGYIPERTWLVKNYYHGQVAPDAMVYSLVMKLLTSDKVKSAHAHFEYPQYTETQAPNSDVSVYFKCTNTTVLPTLSYLSFMGNSIIVKNNSKKEKIAISSLKCEGGTLDFNVIYPLILSPGQQIEINFKGKPNYNNAYDTITVKYRSIGVEFIKNESRSFDMAISNNYSGKDKLLLSSGAINEFKQIVNLVKQLNEQVNNIKKVIEVVGKIVGVLPPVPSIPSNPTPPAAPAPSPAA